MRRGRAALALCAAFPLLPAAGAAETPLRIGVRADAPPFSWRAEDGGHQGFLVDFCVALATSAGRDVVKIEVTAASRFERLSAGEIDLLCDPTTITLSRARAFDFTPILFIANASFAVRIGAATSGPCPGGKATGRRLGFVMETTAGETLAHARQAGAGPFYDPAAPICDPIGVASHVEGIERLCAGSLDYYFGDIDILRALLKSRPDCEAGVDATFATYEPYALAMGPADPELARKLSAAVYQTFADGVAEALFRKHFDASQKSPALDMLFRINTLPQGSESP